MCRNPSPKPMTAASNFPFSIDNTPLSRLLPRKTRNSSLPANHLRTSHWPANANDRKHIWPMWAKTEIAFLYYKTHSDKSKWHFWEIIWHFWKIYAIRPAIFSEESNKNGEPFGQLTRTMHGVFGGTDYCGSVQKTGHPLIWSVAWSCGSVTEKTTIMVESSRIWLKYNDWSLENRAINNEFKILFLQITGQIRRAVFRKWGRWGKHSCQGIVPGCVLPGCA